MGGTDGVDVQLSGRANVGDLDVVDANGVEPLVDTYPGRCAYTALESLVLRSSVLLTISYFDNIFQCWGIA